MKIMWKNKLILKSFKLYYRYRGETMLLSEIITEADVRVVNAFSAAQKAQWLNEVNQEFFDIVKIPQIALFNAVAGVSAYLLSPSVRAKNIDKVMIGNMIYESALYGEIRAGHNQYTLDDDTQFIKFLTPPTLGGQAIVRYYRLPTTVFTSSNLNIQPDAPAEYHWIYILGLASRTAKAMDDVGKGNNITADYQNALLVAQQNYLKGA